MRAVAWDDAAVTPRQRCTTGGAETGKTGAETGKTGAETGKTADGRNKPGHDTMRTIVSPIRYVRADRLGRCEGKTAMPPRHRPKPGLLLSVQPQIDQVPRIGLQFPALDLLDDVRQRRVRRRRQADFLSLAYDEPIEKIDLRPAALHHVLAHRRTVLAAAPVCLLQSVGVVFPGRHQIAFPGPRDHVRIDMMDFLQLVSQRLADADRLAAQSGTEMTQRVVAQDVLADQAGAGRHAVRHRVGHQLRPALAP